MFISALYRHIASSFESLRSSILTASAAASVTLSPFLVIPIGFVRAVSFSAVVFSDSIISMRSEANHASSVVIPSTALR